MGPRVRIQMSNADAILCESYTARHWIEPFIVILHWNPSINPGHAEAARPLPSAQVTLTHNSALSNEIRLQNLHFTEPFSLIGSFPGKQLFRECLQLYDSRSIRLISITFGWFAKIKTKRLTGDPRCWHEEFWLVQRERVKALIPVEAAHRNTSPWSFLNKFNSRYILSQVGRWLYNYVYNCGHVITIGKASPWYLSFVYTSYGSVPVRTE